MAKKTIEELEEEIAHLENALMMVHHSFATDRIKLNPRQLSTVKNVDTTLQLRDKIKWDIEE